MIERSHSKIIAVGDLHGAYHEFLQILEPFNILDDQLNFIATDTTLVQLGDICDRGYDSYNIYQLLIKWQKQAALLNSQVLFILGNHEVMNIFGIYHYNTIEEISSFSAQDQKNNRNAFLDAFSRGGWLFNWLIKQTAIVKVGSLIFAHADLPMSLGSSSIKTINENILSAIIDFDGNKDQTLPEVLFSGSSVLWCRSVSQRPEQCYQDKLSKFLSDNLASTYVCGHTVAKAVNRRFSDNYLCIDTGISPYYYKNLTALLVEDGIIYICTINQGKIEKEKIRDTQ